MLAYYMLRLSS